MPSRALRFLALAALVAAAFLAWQHPQILDIRTVGWVLGGGDWGPNAIGLAAYLRAGNWPGTATPLILSPEGVHLLMTDSNPLVGLLLKPVAPLLPPGVQVIGWWLLACLALHVRFAWLLMRERAPDFASAWLATALLTLLPILYARYVQPNLCAHWLILWALYRFVDRDRARRWLPWLALIGVAGLVHSYLLVMTGAIWASAMLREIVTGDARERLRTAGLIIAVAALVSGLALLHGLTDPPMSTGSYGSFPMALDALINPQMPTYSVFLPSTPDRGIGFEGFQYLGAGLIGLVLIAIAVTIAARRHGEPPATATLWWLTPAFAVLTVIAVTNVVIFRGDRIAFHPLPVPLIHALDIVRSSGRLFWPVAYTIVVASLVAVLRTERRVLILSGALIVQIADMTPMLAAIRADTARAAEPATYRRTLDPRWQTLIASASAIEFEPPDPHRDQALIEEVAWRAMLACRPMRMMYVARVPRSSERRMEADRHAFAAGGLDPERLYVLGPDQRVPAAAKGRVITLDGSAVIPPKKISPAATLCGG